MKLIFPENQQATARAAFGLFSPDQAKHLFDRAQGSGFEPRVIEVAPRTWFIQPGMVNVALFETDEGLLLVDCGCAGDGPALLEAVRSVSDKPLHTVVYTHGHSDHAFGLWAFLDAGERPVIVAHRALPAHFERYIKTAGLNARINNQQPGADGKAWPDAREDFAWPTRLFDDRLELAIGGERFVVRHGKGETDDAAWVWAPERAVIAAGDLITGYLPNAGNPKKVQRYAEEWADAAEEMATLRPSVIIPGHGDPATGTEAVADELTSLARYLRIIVGHTLTGLNNGVLPDEIVDTLEIPAELRDHPRLPAIYDKPEFICRNVIRRYSGWWDGYPSHLLPSSQDAQAAEVARLAGGVAALVARARELAATDLRLACHLAEWAFLADRSDADARTCYDEVLEARAQAEPSLMAQVNFRTGARWVRAAGGAA
ncbi:MBL fold metallo-hydrolase [Streptomyces sp. SID10853]|uniref:alkyl sulfatase dimerization domain-containing protein n=1 Tax=Streptomyces sp. SID10853 TaxID=2706028 RepID=UPI0013BF346E|nr:alkyl sulfatase dimerization domain-containing protein [Streptomyces sp. SID10853]NDZ80674.1 MBL fold metallo-hydrolase [Streptomyces sp. SID10853]